jgi:hypothetical protein
MSIGRGTSHERQQCFWLHDALRSRVMETEGGSSDDTTLNRDAGEAEDAGPADAPGSWSVEM